MKRIAFGTGVQGASHIRSETECQDSWKKTVTADGTVILAVADGHGSKNCPFSKTGSQIAVNVFCSIMSQYIEKYAQSPEMLLSFLNREGDTKIAQAIDFEWKKRVFDNNKRKYGVFKDEELIHVYTQYGTTLLGLVIKDDFLFALQIGDGDIVLASDLGSEFVIKGDKILGVETHSLCKENAWRKAIAKVRKIDFREMLPCLFLMSTDGFANSYKNEEEFLKTCTEYYEAVRQYGYKAVNDNLKNWLSETSSMGCGDDITVMMTYCFEENKPNIGKDCKDSELSSDTLDQKG